MACTVLLLTLTILSYLHDRRLLHINAFRHSLTAVFEKGQSYQLKCIIFCSEVKSLDAIKAAIPTSGFDRIACPTDGTARFNR